MKAAERIIVSGLIIIAASLTAQDRIRVAVIGNSITEWSSYHEKLQALLGNGYAVQRFARAGVTITRHAEVEGSGDYSIWNQPFLKESWDFDPHIVTIMLGTNDCKSNHWPSRKDQLKNDYQDLLDSFLVLGSVRRIYAIRPCPAWQNQWNLSNDTIQLRIWPILDSIADTNGLCKIDAYTPLKDHPEYFGDGVHPNDPGGAVDTLANLIFRALTMDSSCDRGLIDTPDVEAARHPFRAFVLYRNCYRVLYLSSPCPFHSATQTATGTFDTRGRTQSRKRTGCRRQPKGILIRRYRTRAAVMK
jgi:hypothetical protein